ncbi:MAG: molybdopterin-binding oxidoreductase [Pyrinomonas sp.]|uniref:molybdopterin-dependent oxidoreductase n=1 Tax=Pyrinomonas sp. TaxID=2080306 RepID=UPI003320BE5E
MNEAERQPKERFQAAAAAVLAATAAFAVSYFFRAQFNAAFLPEVSAQLGIEFSPPRITRFLIETFGKGAKIGGVAIAFLVYFAAAAALGLFFARTRDVLPGKSAIARGLAFSLLPITFTALFIGAILWIQPQILSGYPLRPTIISLLLFNLTFSLVLSLLADISAPEEGGSQVAHSIARRQTLFGLSVAAITIGFTALVLRGLFRSLVAAVGIVSGRLPSFRTSNEEFYQVSKNAFNPVIDAREWKLSIRGNVERPFSLTYDELLSFPMVERDVTLECVSNEVGGNLISNARWTGVPLKLLLERAVLRDGSRDLALRAADGYTDSIPVQWAQRDETMLAVKMNGETLPRDHGFPVRLLVPGLFGMENVKWLTDIEVVTTDFRGYWQQRGWADTAVVKTMSKFTVPRDGEILQAGQTYEVGGVAFSGNRGISLVEVLIERAGHNAPGGTWIKAELLPEASPTTWTIWRYLWTPEKSGEYVLSVRAVDGQGAPQTAERADPFPDGASGYHRIKVNVA